VRKHPLEQSEPHRATLAAWEPVDKVFAGCAGACGTRTAGISKDVTIQPGVATDQQTYCPVSGVVFRVTASSPSRDLRGTKLYFCCEACAAYFAQNSERVLAARGMTLSEASAPKG